MRRTGHRIRPLEPAGPTLASSPARSTRPSSSRPPTYAAGSPLHPDARAANSPSSTQSARSPPSTTAPQPRSHSPGSSPNGPGSYPSRAPGAWSGSRKTLEPTPSPSPASSLPDSTPPPPSSTEHAASGREPTDDQPAQMHWQAGQQAAHPAWLRLHSTLTSQEGSLIHYRPLGRTGVQVSPLCLGAMMFSPWATTPRRRHPHHPPHPRRRHQLHRHGAGSVLIQ